MTDFEEALLKALDDIREELKLSREMTSRDMQQAMFENILEQVQSQSHGLVVPQGVVGGRGNI